MGYTRDRAFGRESVGSFANGTSRGQQPSWLIARTMSVFVAIADFSYPPAPLPKVATWADNPSQFHSDVVGYFVEY